MIGWRERVRASQRNTSTQSPNLSPCLLWGHSHFFSCAHIFSCIFLFAPQSINISFFYSHPYLILHPASIWLLSCHCHISWKSGALLSTCLYLLTCYSLITQWNYGFYSLHSPLICYSLLWTYGAICLHSFILKLLWLLHHCSFQVASPFFHYLKQVLLRHPLCPFSYFL